MSEELYDAIEKVADMAAEEYGLSAEEADELRTDLFNLMEGE